MAVFVLFVLAALVCVGLLGYICMGIVALIGVFKRTGADKSSRESDSDDQGARISLMSVRKKFYTFYSVLFFMNTAMLTFVWSWEKIPAAYDLAEISEFVGGKMTKAAPVALVLTIFISEGAPGLMVMADYVKNKFVKPIIEAHKAEGYAEGVAEGRAEGMAEGRAEGLAEGMAEGRAEGHAEGIAEGRAEGMAEGEARVKESGREWYKRMLKAKENDEPFDEPPPF